MRNRSLCLVAFPAIVLTPSGCTGGPGGVQARLDEEFSLSVGQRASIAGGTIVFLPWFEESRPNCQSSILRLNLPQALSFLYLAFASDMS